MGSSGPETAAECHETYVALSWFFRDVLELDDPEREAMELAGAISPTVTERLVATLPVDANSEVRADGVPTNPDAGESS